MIDTVAITLPEKCFRVIDHNRFNPNTLNFFQPPYIKIGGGYIKAVNNPTLADKNKCGYMPKLTLIKAIRKSRHEIMLRIEFSAPKIIYDNNFDELGNADFKNLCSELSKKIYLMGVDIVKMEYILNADVSMVHYSKNMILTDYSTPYGLIKEFQKVNFNMHMDINHKDFRNNGHASKIHTNDYEVILYDKLIDLKQAKKSEKKAIERDNYCQLNLLGEDTFSKPFEVLRLEVRINSRKKIKQLLNKYGLHPEPLIFSRLFSSESSKTVLIHTVQYLESCYPKILHSESKTLEDLWIELKINHPSMKPKRLLQAIGCKIMLTKLGVRGLRKLLDPEGAHHWPRLKNELSNLRIDLNVNPFDKLRKSVTDFEKVRLCDYSRVISNLATM